MECYSLGLAVTVEALKKIPEKMKTVYLSSRANDNSQLEQIKNLCRINKIAYQIDDNFIDRHSFKENCYGIGVFEDYEKELASNHHLLLYKFNDEGELGTIMRSAVSFDFHDLVLIDTDIDYFSAKVIRASMGSFFHLNIKKYNSFEAYLKDYPYNLYPFTSKQNKELKNIELIEPYSIIIPQEYKGLDDIFDDSYYLAHHDLDEISLSTLASIVLNYAYHQNVLYDSNNVYKD